MVLGGANYSALAPPRWSPSPPASSPSPASSWWRCPGPTSMWWTSHLPSRWPRSWFASMATTLLIWSTSGGRFDDHWSWGWSIYNKQTENADDQEHYNVHDMPEGREQAMCQLCENLHQVPLPLGSWSLIIMIRIMIMMIMLINWIWLQKGVEGRRYPDLSSWLSDGQCTRGRWNWVSYNQVYCPVQLTVIYLWISIQHTNKKEIAR